MVHNQPILYHTFNLSEKVLLYYLHRYLLLEKLCSCWIGSILIKIVYLYSVIEIEN